MRRYLAAAAVFAAAACSGARTPPPAPALCELDRGQQASGAPDADTWIALLLRGYDRATRRTTMPALDCTGAHVRWEGPALACRDGALAKTELPDRPLAAQDVTVTPRSATSSLVWIATHRFASGDALGPAALVESRGTALRVIALGPLRGYPGRARLRLESLGGRPVLAAEGELCPSSDPASCVRAARILPLRAGRFVPQPLVDEGGACLSPAWVELARREQRKSESGWERLDLGATMVFGEGGLVVDEQMAILDLAKGASTPGRVLHRAHGARSIRWSDERLVASAQPLWTLMAGGRGQP